MVLAAVLALALGGTAALGAEGGAWAERAAAAKAAYDGGDAAGAEALWLEAGREGVGGAGLWYDLGNACYRQGKWAEAVRWFRKAQRETPREPDVEYNLSLAAQAAGAALPGRSAAERWMGGLSRKEWGWVAEAGFWALLGLGAAWVAAGAAWRERLRGAVGVAAAVLALGLAGVSWGWWEERRPECVVMGEGSAALRSAPLEGAAAVAEVPSGTIVRKVGEQGYWVEVSGGGARGWVEAGRVKAVGE